MPTGPRIYWKRDEESSSGRGAQGYAAHYTPEMARIVWAVARSCDSFVAEVWITEAFRNIRDSRDLHEECRALDFTLRTASGSRPAEMVYRDVGDRVQAILGPDYDVVVHGEGANLHIHVEYDPR